MKNISDKIISNKQIFGIFSDFQKFNYLNKSVLNYASEALNVHTSMRALNIGIHDGRKNCGKYYG